VPVGDRRQTLKLWDLAGALRDGGRDGVPGRARERALGVTGTVWSVAFSGDGRTLVSGGVDGAGFWDVGTGLARAGLPALDGKEVAVAGSVVVGSPNHPFYSNQEPQPLWRLDLDTGRHRVLPVAGLHPALSADGHRLAYLEGRSIRIFDMATERVVLTLATNRLVFRLRFDPEGRRILAAGQMTAARLWDLGTPGTPVASFAGEHNVWDAVFIPGQPWLAVATSHQQIELWNESPPEKRGSLAGHTSEVWTVAATPDGRYLVSGGKDATVRVWDARVPERVVSVSHWRDAPLVVSATGRQLLTYTPGAVARAADPRAAETAEVGTFQTRQGDPRAGGQSTLWTLASDGDGAGRGGGEGLDVGPSRSRPIRSGRIDGYPLGFAADGRHVLVMPSDRRELEWWDPVEGRLARTVGLEGGPGRLTLGDLVVTGDGAWLVGPEETGVFHRWSTRDGRRSGPGWAGVSGVTPAGRPAGSGAGGVPQRRLRALAVGMTGRWLAYAPFGQVQAHLVDLDAGVGVVLAGHRDDIAALAFSPDGQRLASGSVDGTLRLWEVPGGRAIGELPGHQESAEAVAFSADGRTLVSASVGVDLAFWHVATLRELARIPHAEVGMHLRFTGDGTRLLLNATPGNLETASDRVEIWEAPGVGQARRLR
jgi:WD40 repeat protein